MATKTTEQKLHSVFRRIMNFDQCSVIILHTHFGFKNIVILFVFVNFVVGNAHIYLFILKAFIILFPPNYFHCFDDGTQSTLIHNPSKQDNI